MDLPNACAKTHRGNVRSISARMHRVCRFATKLGVERRKLTGRTHCSKRWIGIRSTFEP